MKKIQLLACGLFLSLGCSTSKDDLPVAGSLFPAESEVFGKAVAKEIRGIVTNLNEKGIDYTQANHSPAVRQRLFVALYKDIPEVSATRPRHEDYDIVPSVSRENMNQLTDRQMAVLTDIVQGYRASRSDEEFIGKLEDINKKIHAIPEIQRERLFNLSAALYYGLKEIQLLRKQGLMTPAGNPIMSIPRLKSFGEDGGSDDGGECRQLESATAIAVGSHVLWDGVIYVVKQTAYAAARALWLVTACLLQTSSGPDCESLAVQCVEKGYKIVDGRSVKMECSQCRLFCVSNGYWNHSACPLH